jgi:methyl-accepting chemotaxis protein
MFLLNKTKIGTRLMLGFTVMLALVLVLGVVALFSLNKLSTTMENTLNGDARLAEISNNAYGSTISMLRYEKDTLVNIQDSTGRYQSFMKWNTDLAALNIQIDNLKKLCDTLGRKEDIASLDKATGHIDNYAKAFKNLYGKIESGFVKDVSEANSADLLAKNDAESTEFIINGFSNRAVAALEEARNLSGSVSARAKVFVVICVIIASILGILISLFISTSIRLPLNGLTGMLKDISEGEGDLTVEIKILRKDETGILASFFNKFVNKIREVVADTKNASHKLLDTSSEMNNTATNLMENTRNQAASAEEISATIDQVSSGVDSIAKNSNHQYTMLSSLIAEVEDLSEVIRDMGKSVQDTMSLSTNISSDAKSGEESVRKMTAGMAKITESSGKISGIISIINDISDRINLLSLNAAIEAARAGDAGRGFAVVADEISKLAEQTSESIKEIDSLVRINAEETTAGMTNVLNTNQTIGRSIEGVSTIMNKMNSIFEFMNKQVTISKNIDTEINLLKNISDEIRTSTAEQKIAFEEILKSIALINELSQSNASATEQLAAISGNISRLSAALDARVNFFKV